MGGKKTKTTKKKIVSAAWRLFYEQGYDNTTVDDIVEESGTSKGSFYHYFDGKDALMGTLAYVFDEKYEDLMPTLNENCPNFLCTQHLPIFVKHITDDLAVFLTAFIKPGVAALAAQYVVIKCTSVNIQCFTDRMDFIFSIERL